MRGDDHISNTPKQIMLYNALGATLPRFAHLPMIHGLDGKKLSKRHGATAVGDYRHLGILPQAMLNFLALLGWSPGNDIEVMTVPQMIELFSVEGLSKKAAIFDPKKLEWMNGQHLSLLPSESLAPIVSDALVEAGLVTRDEINVRRVWLISLIDLLKLRSRTIDDIVRQAAPYLAEHVSYDAEAVAKQWKDRSTTIDMLSSVRSTLAAINKWEPQHMEEALRAEAGRRGIGAGKLFQPLRVALTGLTVSAGIFDVLALLGRDRSLARIDDATSFLRAG
jgi:glutamyl-tRNA synthetase